MASILITGASGFIGSFLVEEAVARGMQTWAGMRASSSRKYLQDSRINFLELDFTSPEGLKQALAKHRDEHGAFDFVVHCAGATKCLDKAEFDRVNYEQTCRFVDVLRALDMQPKQFLFVSTLSVYGPVHEETYEPIREQDTPCPNTAYGISKLKAERYLQSLPDLPYVFFRPTGVYGPRERDYFLMAKSIKQHVDTQAGFKRQDLTFVYVKDVVQAVFLAIEKGVTRRAYFLSDGKVYSSRTYSDLIKQELGNPFVVRFTCPLWVLKVVSCISEWVCKLLGRTSTLNSDKYQIMKQRNWQCDIAPTIDELGYQPQYDLNRGVKETIAWYKEEGWL
ncbi:MAG: NAD(P)-dependent oxidoreductase [Bacteroides sp.]|nr:NAD(P)-dependent oxidoreductase [Bacteroides sp.]